MTPPHLTFFVELPSEPLVGLFAEPGVIDFLVDRRCALAMGILDLTPARAGVVRQLESRGVPVTGWLLLDVADGYWLNADNSGRARARYEETVDWAAREDIELHRIGLDIEFPRADAELLRSNPRAALRTLFRCRRSAAQVRAAEQDYVDLAAEIRAAGRSVESYHLPQILDERIAGSTLLRRMLGLVDVPTDAEVFMLYASYFGSAGARAYYADSSCVALGVTGGGVHADEPEEVAHRLSWGELEQDLLAAAAVTDQIYVFSLEGCAQQQMLGRIAALDWNRRHADLARGAWRRARRRRRAIQWLLRAEPVLDRLFRGGGGSMARMVTE